MVNLDKWEKVTRDEIRTGDKIKRISIQPDGTRAVITGTVAGYNAFSGTFLSKDKFALIMDSYPESMKVDLYRRKKPTQEELDAKFVFPTAVGAVIEADLKRDGETRQYVYNGFRWHWTNSTSPSHRSEADLRHANKNFNIISEGIK